MEVMDKINTDVEVEILDEGPPEPGKRRSGKKVNMI